MLAFSKIMKKYDKVFVTLQFTFNQLAFLEFSLNFLNYLQITSRNASKTYLQIVDTSFLGSSEEVCNAATYTDSV